MTRYEHIDIAKGIGILLVVFFHLPDIGKLTYFNNWGGWITTFYMPLFFTLSGLFFKADKLGQRIKRLLIPYLIFYCIGFAFDCFRYALKHETIEWVKFFDPFLGSTIGYSNSPVWFLLALAEMSIIGFCLLKKMPKLYAFAVSIIIGIAGYICGQHNLLQPYYISVSLMCMPFFIGGLTFKEYVLKEYKYSFVGVLLLCASFLIYLPNTPKCNVSQCYVDCSFLQFAIICILATVGVVLLSQFISKHTKYVNRVLSYYGENSLTVLCTHLLFIMIPAALNRFIHCNSLSLLLGFVIIMIIEIQLIELINRKFKFIIGK